MMYHAESAIAQGELFASVPDLIPCETSVRSSCAASQLCTNGLDTLHQSLAGQSVRRRTVRQGEALYRAGDTFTNLYRLHSGSIKLRVTNYAGIEQITSFPIAGTILGFDGVETGLHACDAVALEHSLVCVLPFSEVSGLCGQDMRAAGLLNRLIAGEASYYRQFLLVLACMKSEGRIANFLVDMADRMAANGYSSHEFMLKMTREDIANHLGMKLETVSRVFTRLKNARIVDVRRRHLKITDLDALRRIGNGESSALTAL